VKAAQPSHWPSLGPGDLLKAEGLLVDTERMRPDLLSALPLESPDVGDDALSGLIRAERIRMLFAPTWPVMIVANVAAGGLAALLWPTMDPVQLGAWVVVCCLASIVRLLHLHRYIKADNKADPRWLRGLGWACALHGASWGLIGLSIPHDDMVTTAVIVATLVGASAVCTLAMQADLRVNLAINVPMVLPAIGVLATRMDGYGWFGSIGLVALLALLMSESARAERRMTELLWLRFTTDRIASERAEALQLAHEHSAVKDQFLATMSHEMRTPLHGILGLSRLAHGQLPDRPGVLRDTRHQLALIERTGEHLLGIINDVLDFSRIEAGKMVTVRAPLELRGLLDDALALQNISACDKGLTLTHTIDLPETCWVQGDAARLRQVLHNLLGNAVKFTDAGGVSLVVRRGPADDPARRSDVEFEVHDTGPGIPDFELPRVFEAFHQVDGSFGRRHTGTGLGLTISREIARAMGGDIVVSSVWGQGTTFTLRVPLAPVAAPHPPQARPEPTAAPTPGASAPLASGAEPAQLAVDGTPLPPPPARAHVLLAEDNAVNALVAEATLVNLGLEVTRVEDGEAALAALCVPQHPYCLVLMDCQMPEIDGLEATRRLRRWEHAHGRGRIPVVALTANALPSDRERCTAAGMDGHLAKPFRQDELMNALRPHLPTSSASHSTA